MATVRDPDRPAELHYYVIVRTLGHPSKVRRSVGKTIAKLLALNFNDSEVHVGSKKGGKIKWSPLDHDFGMGEA